MKLQFSTAFLLIMVGELANTVPCNFATVNQLDLLRSVLDGRGRLTEAVAYESTRSARLLPSLGRLATDD